MFCNNTFVSIGKSSPSRTPNTGAHPDFHHGHSYHDYDQYDYHDHNHDHHLDHYHKNHDNHDSDHHDEREIDTECKAKVEEVDSEDASKMKEEIRWMDI